MISAHDVIRAYEIAEKEDLKPIFELSADHKILRRRDNGEPVCTVDEYVQFLREKLHCDFETIYSEHATLTEVYQCRQCGTVIFGGDDESRYNHNEKCPTCCNDESVCYNKYWTKAQIESDPEKQRTIESLHKMQAEKAAEFARIKARGGLYDWQKWRKRFKFKNHVLLITSVCKEYGQQVRSKYLEVKLSRNSDCCLVFHTDIPMNWHYFYLKHIYRYTRRCSPALRKYFPWQHKPQELDESIN